MHFGCSSERRDPLLTRSNPSCPCSSVRLTETLGSVVFSLHIMQAQVSSPFVCLLINLQLVGFLMLCHKQCIVDMAKVKLFWSKCEMYIYSQFSNLYIQLFNGTSFPCRLLELGQKSRFTLFRPAIPCLKISLDPYRLTNMELQ